MPGASVSVVARQYDVNATQVLMWRRGYRDAGEQPGLQPPSSTPALVPVTITPETEETAVAPPALPAEPASETTEIELPLKDSITAVLPGCLLLNRNRVEPNGCRENPQRSARQR